MGDNRLILFCPRLQFSWYAVHVVGSNCLESQYARVHVYGNKSGNFNKERMCDLFHCIQFQNTVEHDHQSLRRNLEFI